MGTACSTRATSTSLALLVNSVVNVMMVSMEANAKFDVLVMAKGSVERMGSAYATEGLPASSAIYVSRAL